MNKKQITDAKKKGMIILRPQLKQGVGWKIVYATSKGGWATHGLYKNWVWDDQKEAEKVIDGMVSSHPDLFIKD